MRRHNLESNCIQASFQMQSDEIALLELTRCEGDKPLRRHWERDILNADRIDKRQHGRFARSRPQKREEYFTEDIFKESKSFDCEGGEKLKARFWTERVAYRGECPFLGGVSKPGHPLFVADRLIKVDRLCTDPAVADASERGLRHCAPASCKTQDAQSVCGDGRISYYTVLVTRD